MNLNIVISSEETSKKNKESIQNNNPEKKVGRNENALWI